MDQIGEVLDSMRDYHLRLENIIEQQPVSIQITKDHLNTLKRVMSKKLKMELSLDEAVCSICLEEIRSRQHCSVLHCSHIYHKKCAEMWFTKKCIHPTCPCCRKDIRI